VETVTTRNRGLDKALQSQVKEKESVSAQLVEVTQKGDDLERLVQTKLANEARRERQIQDLESRVQQLQQDVGDERAKREITEKDARSKAQALEQQVQDCKQELAHLQKHANALQNDLDEAQDRAGQLKQSLEEREATLRSERDKYEKRANEDRRRLASTLEAGHAVYAAICKRDEEHQLASASPIGANSSLSQLWLEDPISPTRVSAQGSRIDSLESDAEESWVGCAA
jgi:chromosome segregation ATPase